MRALYDVPAPAKLNLFLHVLGRRSDGMHLLQSVFMLIDWCDVLHFQLRRDGQIRRRDSGAALPADDLVVRAATLLRSKTGCRHGVDVHLEKNIPLQAGLGGGSSDAATTLLALNRLWDLNLSRRELAGIGLALGADVPFFIAGHNAWVEGVGERVRRVEVPAARFVVIKPPWGLQTGAVFQALGAACWSGPATMADFVAAPFAFGKNDLQEAAGRVCPEMKTALSLLSGRHLFGKMTGAGSAIFARLPDAGEQQQVLECPPRWQMRVCQNLMEHPLVHWAR
ncbi:MAG: 4-(cytidine 5'-diphospho)-2-C-methyl-D-erythritol kinase [Ottowia sp.]|nr:4-(cytidine 5'-diphospho)-2-C-methyl-D-erythritol kinase [Ottowia sp.]